MAAVELQKLDQITFMETGKKWLIPDGLMEESEDGTLWLQISASNYGLCNLLNNGNVGGKPSLKNSRGLQALLSCRATVFESTQHPEPEGNVLQRKRKRSSTLPTSLRISTKQGFIIAKTPARKNEDLKILYDTDNMSTFCTFMFEEGAECIEPERRAYSSKKDRQNS